MIKKWVAAGIFTLGTLVAPLSGAVAGESLPWISFSDGLGNSLNLSWVQSGSGYVIGTMDGEGKRQNVIQSLSSGTIEYGGYMDPDPFISYFWGVTNTTATTQFYSVTFGTPLVPTVAGANTVFASLTGGLTDVGDNGISFSIANPFAQVSQVGFPLTDMGVGVGGSFFDAGSGTLPARPHGYGALTAGPQAGPVSSWTFMQATLAFSLSAGDSVALNGFASIVPGSPITPVPEPGSFALLAAGLVGLGAVVRRRRLAISHG